MEIKKFHVKSECPQGNTPYWGQVKMTYSKFFLNEGEKERCWKEKLVGQEDAHSSLSLGMFTIPLESCAYVKP